jgi:hypothetical protein
MINTQPRFRWLAEQFESLKDGLEETFDPDERKEFLRRMKVILDEVDVLMLKESSQLGPKERAGTLGFGPK